MQTPLLIQFLLCPVVLLSLLRVTAPYGRHHQAGWGPALPNRLAWLLMELPALLVITILVLGNSAATSPQAWVPLSFWLIHYGYRSFVFPALMHPSDRTFPALLVVFAIAFNSLNGYNNAEALIVNGRNDASLISLHFVLGTAVFFAGFVLHVFSGLTRIVHGVFAHLLAIVHGVVDCVADVIHGITRCISGVVHGIASGVHGIACCISYCVTRLFSFVRYRAHGIGSRLANALRVFLAAGRKAKNHHRCQYGTRYFLCFHTLTP